MPNDSTVRKTVLPGGLRVVTEFLPSVRSVALGIWVGVGSRDEDQAHAGATHYLEHLLFKGTRQRTALDISAAMDAVGGELNAFTGKEYTCYYARVLDADLPLAIDVLSDMVTVLADRAEGRGRRAERGARRDRDERGRPGGHGPRGVHGAALRRHAARPPGPRHGRVDQRDHPGPDLGALRRQVHRAAPRGRGGGQPGSRRGGGQGPVRRSTGALEATSGEAPAAPRLRKPGAVLWEGYGPSAGSGREAGVPADRAGQPGARLRRAGPHGPAAVRARRAERRARRRHVVAAVPGGPREAGAGLLGLQLHRAARGHRHVGPLRRLPAVQGRRGAVDLRRRDREGRRTRG